MGTGGLQFLIDNKFCMAGAARWTPYAFVHEPSFLRSINQQNPALICAMATVALTYSIINGRHMRSEAEKLLEATRKYVPTFMENPDVSCVQALLFLMYGCSSNDQLSASWMYQSMASRMAQSLRLYEERPDLPWIEQETRRRIWWWCVVPDFTISTLLKRARCLQNFDYTTVRLPAPQHVYLSHRGSNPPPIRDGGYLIDAPDPSHVNLTALILRLYKVYFGITTYRMNIQDAIQAGTALNPLVHQDPQVVVLEAELQDAFAFLPSHMRNLDAVGDMSDPEQWALCYVHILYHGFMTALHLPNLALLLALDAPDKFDASPGALRAIDNSRKSVESLTRIYERLLGMEDQKRNFPFVGMDRVYEAIVTCMVLGSLDASRGDTSGLSNALSDIQIHLALIRQTGARIRPHRAWVRILEEAIPSIENAESDVARHKVMKLAGTFFSVQFDNFRDRTHQILLEMDDEERRKGKWVDEGVNSGIGLWSGDVGIGRAKAVDAANAAAALAGGPPGGAGEMWKYKDEMELKHAGGPAALVTNVDQAMAVDQMDWIMQKDGSSAADAVQGGSNSLEQAMWNNGGQRPVQGAAMNNAALMPPPAMPVQQRRIRHPTSRKSPPGHQRHLQQSQAQQFSSPSPPRTHSPSNILSRRHSALAAAIPDMSDMSEANPLQAPTTPASSYTSMTPPSTVASSPPHYNNNNNNNSATPSSQPASPARNTAPASSPPFFTPPPPVDTTNHQQTHYQQQHPSQHALSFLTSPTVHHPQSYNNQPGQNTPPSIPLPMPHLSISTPPMSGYMCLPIPMGETSGQVTGGMIGFPEDLEDWLLDDEWDRYNISYHA
ncbi:hypothetical protein HK097_007446 [Rhizophlyctis rosea]|uniref:Xylanolytic transcriptional activator regulatory domain-containing protein n=1 Tax=Rhizophlyctis rosea TaxID=64517 RepID=A0AAD5SDV2_9FUNG|nr:hypothetical protein HK097_007446 [Rhizophlyctis rosea]